MKERRLEILGILSVAVSLLIFASLIGYNSNEDPGISPNILIENPMGILGVWIGYFFIKLTFGYSSFILPLITITWGIWFFTHKAFQAISRLSGYLLGLVVLSSITIGAAQVFWYGIENVTYNLSGMIGGLISAMIFDFLGAIGTIIILLSLWLILVRGYFGFSFYEPIKLFIDNYKQKQADKKLVTKQEEAENEKRVHTQNLKSKIDEQRNNEEEILKIDEENQPKAADKDKLPKKIEDEKENPEKDINDSKEIDLEKESPDNQIKQEVETDIDEDLEVGEIIEEEEVNLDTVEERKAPKKEYQLPSADLLTNPVNIQSGMSRDELVERANFLQQSLETFGVMGKVVNVSPGPVITLFEVEPAEGVRVNKFVALSDDLARVMEASRV